MSSYHLLSGLCFSLKLQQSCGKCLTWARQIILFNFPLAVFLAQVNVNCKEKVRWDMTLRWLVRFTLLLKHWPLPSHYIIGVFMLWRQLGSIRYGWHVMCFSCSVTCRPLYGLWQTAAVWPGSLGSEWEKLVLY